MQIAEDRQALLIRPMVDDMRQQIGIGAAGDTLNIQMDDEVVRM
jgi:hypothetical protein